MLSRLISVVCIVLIAKGTMIAQNEEATPTIIPKTGLLLTSSQSSGDRIRRRPPSLSGGGPVRVQLIEGTLADFHPTKDQRLEGQEGWQWKSVEFSEDGGVGERGSYLYAPVESDQPQILILNAAGQSETYVNGQPRGGDVYNRGDVHVPIQLHEGINSLFFRSGRGAFKVRLYEPPAPIFINTADMTLPDLVVGSDVDTWGAIIVINATDKPAEGLTLVTKMPGLKNISTPIPTIPPLSIRKTGFRLTGVAPVTKGDLTGWVELHNPATHVLHNIKLSLKVAEPDENRKVTFVSDIDGSVQYFGLRPAVPLSSDGPAPAIVLSCHGASVQAIGQSAAYSTKSWFHIVAPTNRRPYGYDWEDFGRMDAMEVLGIAKQTLKHDPSRIYLTGHSMGGHGTWHLGVTYPDKFAAIGPSAGWLSRSSYGRRGGSDEEISAMQALLNRCRLSGETVELAANLKQVGVYILHGGDDDNVPASQARRMSEVLEEFHHDWYYHEEPGMGHWWGNEYNDGGSACVDWPFMFDLFACHALAPTTAVREVEFVTANPGVSSSCHWLGIEGQIRHLDISKAHVYVWPQKRLFKGTTENVAVLRLDAGHLGTHGPITVELDGQSLSDIAFPEQARSLWLAKEEGSWKCIDKPSVRQKGPHRYGGIKDELKHRFLFVYGTTGTNEENAWAFAKARYDAETFWYRGNASAETIPDTSFEPTRYADRTVVLYGNAQTNAAWKSLLSDSPVQVRRGSIAVGNRSFEGDDLSAIFVQPRPDSDVASVAVVSGSGPIGMRSTYPVSFFPSFVRFPDCVIARVNSEQQSSTENMAVGFFGLDWSVQNGEFAFAD